MAETIAETIPTVDRTDFSISYQVVTPIPPLPGELAKLAENGTSLDLEKVQALSTDNLARLYHDARRYRANAEASFSREIRWLQEATRKAELSRAELSYPINVLEWEWKRRRAGATITWQSVRKVLKEAGLVAETADHYGYYTRKAQQGRGDVLFTVRKSSEESVYVSLDDSPGLDKAQAALEQAGYVITNREDKSTNPSHYSHSLTVAKLRPGQTLADLEAPYSPPQTTTPTE